MRLANRKYEVFASYSLVLWLLVTMDGFWCWIVPSIVFQVLSFAAVLFATILMYINNELYSIKCRKPLVVTYIIFLIYTLLNVLLLDKFLPIIGRFLSLSPFLMILLWKDKVLSDSYTFFRKIFLFFSAGAILLTFLTLTGLIDLFPYLEIEDTGRDFYTNKGTVFRVYGFGNLSVHKDTGAFTGFLPRALGPFHEGGHFAIYLGIIIVIDRMLNNKLNPIFVICGIFTFSMVFVIFFLVSELIDIIINKKSKIRVYLLASVAVLLLLLFLPSYIKDAFWFMLFERNFSDVVSSISQSGLSTGLNERVNSAALRTFENFINSDEILFGSSSKMGYEVMSDYRGIMMSRGLLGLVSTVMVLLSSLLVAKRQYLIYWFAIIALVFLHRAWMFNSCYLQCMIILGFAARRCVSQECFSK